MITQDAAYTLMKDIDTMFTEITTVDSFDMVNDIYMLERPECIQELRELVFQYAQRLANS